MSNFTDSFLSANTANFPSDQLPSLRQRLDLLDDSQANQVIASSDIKNPTTALILSLFAGGLGVDRFYLGQTGLGVGKLLVCTVLAIFTLGISLLFSWIWVIIDWFLIMKAAKQANLNTINTALATMVSPAQPAQPAQSEPTQEVNQ